MAGLNISQFELRRAIVEVRYPKAYLIWDNAGKLWAEAKKRWATLDVREAEPGKTVFWLDDRSELSVLIDKARLTQERPKDFDKFVITVTEFLGLTNDMLGLYEYERVGLRLVYRKKYEDKFAASNAMLSADILKVPNMPQFNIDGRAVLPEYVMRLEDDKKGVTVRLKAETETQEFSPPLQMDEIEKAKVETHGVVFDVDYHTIGTLTVGQFRAKDWLNGAHRAIRRDSATFLGG